MLCLAVVGRAQNGKSTVARAIMKAAKNLNRTAMVFEISNYILREAIELNLLPNKTREELTSKEIEELVKLGSERRNEDPAYWINTLRTNMLVGGPDVAIVPNVRYCNEAQMVRDLGGKIIRVKSYVVDGVEYISPDRNPNHPSETEHHSIMADYFLTSRRGESILLARQAATLFNYLIEEAGSVN